MSRYMIAKMAVAILIIATFAGCETTGEAAGLGALIGAGAGAIIGADSGHWAEGAAIGGALGAAGGAVGHDVRKTRAEKTRDAYETHEVYQYESTEGEKMTFEDAQVYPDSARRGAFVDVSLQYAILGTGAGREVTETRIVKRDGEVIAQISSQRYTRNDGTWISRQEFRIPESWQPGIYSMEQIAETRDSRISGSTTFYVE